MGLLRPASTTAGYLKAGFQGFQGAGKTFTATELAIAARRHFGLDGPLAFFDTESGSDYLAQKVKAATGCDLLVVKSRALDDLIATVPECIEAGVSVLLVDSVTHLWREVCDSYLAQVNEALARRAKEKRWRNWSPRTKLEFQDWGPIKAHWARWTDVYLNAPINIIICGRAGHTYDFTEDEKGKKELIKTGTKMKAEGEFGFEPSLLIEMELVHTNPQKGQPRATRHRATVLKDRFDVLQGKVKDFTPGTATGTPVWTFLKPHVERLAPAAHTTIDTESRSSFQVGGEGDAGWARERRNREILCETIQAEIVRAYPGQTKEEKKAKVELLERHFGTLSWKAVESMSSEELTAGLDRLRRELRPDEYAADQGQLDLDGDGPPDFDAAGEVQGG